MLFGFQFHYFGFQHLHIFGAGNAQIGFPLQFANGVMYVLVGRVYRYFNEQIQGVVMLIHN